MKRPSSARLAGGESLLLSSAQPSLRPLQATAPVYQQGQPHQAKQFFQARPGTTATHFESLHSLAVINAQRGDLEAAKRFVRKAIRRNPYSSEAYNTLGYIMQALNCLDDAMAAYRKAIALNSDYATAYNNIGNVLLRKGEHEKAVEQYRTAIAKKPDFAEAIKNLGGALLALERYEEAASCSDRALALQPGLAGAHFHKGVALETIGRLDEARDSYARAVDAAPRSGRFHLSLAESRRHVADDPHLAQMERLASEITALPEDEQMCLHFALAKALMDVGQHKRAFNHLLQGNALKRKGLSYDIRTELASFDRIKATFTSELITSRSHLGFPSPVPIFIVGMPRSGTSLVEQIIASHPKVFGAGERDDFYKAISRTVARNARGAGFLERIGDLGAVDLQQIGSTYVEQVSKAAPKCEHFTDKLPGNFKYIGMIHLTLPYARIIHVQRSPLDTCVSCFSKLFSGDLPYTYGLEDLGKYYKSYEELMAHWRKVLPPGHMLEVHYESVVADLESEARRLIEYCGLEWDERCLTFHQTDRPVRTASASQVRQPIYRSSIGRWRAYEELLRPLLDALEPNRGHRVPSAE